VALCPGREELLGDVPGDLKGLGEGAALRDETLDFVRGRELDPLGELLDVEVEHAFYRIFRGWPTG